MPLRLKFMQLRFGNTSLRFRVRSMLSFLLHCCFALSDVNYLDIYLHIAYMVLDPLQPPNSLGGRI